MTRRSLVVVAACLAAAGRAGAQVDTTARRHPPAARDTLALDSTRRDTTARDTSARLLPVYPAPRPEGPLPRGTRYSFPVDSLVFSNVETLADLLAHVPGVYVARGGAFGQPEIVLYGGRGPAALEVYWDGVPYLPAGRDSIYLDPARVSLAPLERVDVVVLPAALRVYLVTARQASTAAATEIRVLTGDVSHAGYRGSFAKRWRSGVGLSLAGDWNTIAGYPNSATTAFSGVDLWLKADYVPTARGGASYEIVSSSWHRAAGPVTGFVRQERRDAIFRFFLAHRDDGLGPRFDLALATTGVRRDTAVAARTLPQGIIQLADAWPRAHASIALRFQDEHRPLQVEGRAAWSPVPPVSLAADLRRASYDLSRAGTRAHLAAGLTLPLGLTARGDVAWSHDLQAPALGTDTLQRTTDLSGALRWDGRWAALELGGARRGAFAPRGGPTGLKSVDSLGPSPQANYVTAAASLRPVAGLTLSGWYWHPLQGHDADFEPPHHGRLSATFYSKFWRVYKSGDFALRGELAMESWSAGPGGRDSLGQALILPGATFVDWNLEVQVAGVTIFWMIRNNNLMRAGYVPGLDYPRRGQFYGVRWVFTN